MPVPATHSKCSTAGPSQSGAGGDKCTGRVGCPAGGKVFLGREGNLKTREDGTFHGNKNDGDGEARCSGACDALGGGL